MRTLKSPIFIIPVSYFAFVLALVILVGPKSSPPPWLASSGDGLMAEQGLEEEADLLTVGHLAEEGPLVEHHELVDLCVEHLQRVPGRFPKADIEAVCAKVDWLKGCWSEEKVPIYHYERTSDHPEAKKIFALALIHGDEHPAGAVARAWMRRLERINPRNSWRVVPVANPDGWYKSTRTNSRGVDLNRNFPTDDWEETALEAWRQHGSNSRRYPGPYGASESETRCLMAHFESFKPDFIVSVHTPLGVLDFDGPPLNFPRVDRLPWISLGHFPGSLGRYMWRDHDVPVLTIELKGNEKGGLESLAQFDQLQDISGTVAIQADELVKRDEP